LNAAGRGEKAEGRPDFRPSLSVVPGRAAQGKTSEFVEKALILKKIRAFSGIGSEFWLSALSSSAEATRPPGKRRMLQPRRDFAEMGSSMSEN
jgi:hypothetical protein